MLRRVWNAAELAGSTKVVLADQLRIPIHICFGAYEAASTEELDDLITDLQAERARR